LILDGQLFIKVLAHWTVKNCVCYKNHCFYSAFLQNQFDALINALQLNEAPLFQKKESGASNIS
jgi:hypothetical protein